MGCGNTKQTRPSSASTTKNGGPVPPSEQPAAQRKKGEAKGDAKASSATSKKPPSGQSRRSSIKQKEGESIIKQHPPRKPQRLEDQQVSIPKPKQQNKNGTNLKRSSDPQSSLTPNPQFRVRVTPASIDESKEDLSITGPRTCNEHRNKAFEYWCETCKLLICTDCFVRDHLQVHGHITYALGLARDKLVTELEIQLNYLRTSIKNLQPFINELVEFQQREEALAHELVLSKQRLRKEAGDIETSLNSAKRYLDHWGDSKLHATPLMLFHASAFIKEKADNLKEEILKTMHSLEPYRIYPYYTMQVDREPESFMDYVCQKEIYNEKDVEKRLQKFIVAHIFKQSYPFLLSEYDYNGSFNLRIEFEHHLQHNPALKQETVSPEIKYQETRRQLQKYMSKVTLHNSHLKASQFNSFFHIQPDDMDLLTDAILDVAMCSGEGTMPLAHMCRHLVNVCSTTNYRFIADNLPLLLKDRCLKMVQGDVYAIQKDRVKQGEKSIPSQDTNAPEDHRVWRRYKNLIRFIGEIFVMGLLSQGALTYSVENLLIRNDEQHHLMECVCILLLTTGPVLDSTLEMQIQLDDYLKNLEEKLKTSPNRYIEHLIQYILELRQNKWNLRQCGHTVCDTVKKEAIQEMVNQVLEEAAASYEKNHNSEIEENFTSNNPEFMDFESSTSKQD